MVLKCAKAQTIPAGHFDFIISGALETHTVSGHLNALGRSKYCLIFISILSRHQKEETISMAEGLCIRCFRCNLPKKSCMLIS